MRLTKRTGSLQEAGNVGFTKRTRHRRTGRFSGSRPPISALPLPYKTNQACFAIGHLGFTKRTPSPATGQNDITKRTRGRDRNEILLFAASEPERNASFPDLAFRRINFRRLMADAKPKRSARFSIVGAGLGRKSLILLIEIPVTAFLK
jgi:hypothetical protein